MVKVLKWFHICGHTLYRVQNACLVLNIRHVHRLVHKQVWRYHSQEQMQVEKASLGKESGSRIEMKKEPFEVARCWQYQGQVFYVVTTIPQVWFLSNSQASTQKAKFGAMAVTFRAFPCCPVGLSLFSIENMHVGNNSGSQNGSVAWWTEYFKL